MTTSKRYTTCPVCRSQKVLRFARYDGYEWWSECISGKDHGLYVLRDGSRRQWPKRIRFSESGWLQTPDGKLKVHLKKLMYGPAGIGPSRRLCNVEDITSE